ncbi:MAG: T9SS type A sorting domain-containing protein [Candidatus Eisenbacteria bacterium]|nr:T9SS type A sorting domain-containing protein [Candidatus Eisenbacteria bacterium]
MRRKPVSLFLRLTLIPAVLLALLIPLPVAGAEEPMLAVRLLDGGDAVYAVSEIDQVVFEGDSLLVQRSGASASYALASIEKIEFLWAFSGVTDPDDAAHLVKAIRLFQNRPNPFTPVTKIGFELAQAGRVELAIYSVDGRLIRTLINEDRQAGSHEAIWDGCDAEGKKVASGVYFYKLAGPDIAESRRMILLP